MPSAAGRITDGTVNKYSALFLPIKTHLFANRDHVNLFLGLLQRTKNNHC